MELLRVSACKLKITLTCDDMHRFSLRGEDMDYENAETRRAFWEILGEAKEETGFDATRDRVMIRVFPSRDGGCEMFVTKLDALPPSAHTAQSAGALYRFAGMREVLAACRALEEAGYDKDAALFGEETGKGCYLLLPDGEIPFLSEFAEERIREEEIPYIRDHAPCFLAKDAIRKLSDLFV